MAGNWRASRLPIATASHGQTMAYASTISQPQPKLTNLGKTASVYAISAPASGIARTRWV